MRVMGIDPGLANTGLAVVGPSGSLEHCEWYRTTPSRAKGRRTSADDRDRLLEIVEWIRPFLVSSASRPDLIALEWYAPRKLASGYWSKRGWTTVLVVGAIIAMAREFGIESVVQRPPFEAELYYDPLILRAVPRNGRAHVVDALAHARRACIRRGLKVDGR